MKLDQRAERNLKGVHPDLVKVVRRAAEITAVNFTITEGQRDAKRQKKLVAKGGLACAVDVGALIDGKLRWDWPLYERLAVAFKQAAHDVGIPVEWGGDWRSFKDGCHFQLPWQKYPA